MPKPSNGALVAPPFSRLVEARHLVLEHEHWANPRSVTALDPASLDELAADLKLRGPQVPLDVQKVKISDGRVIDLVLDGQRRTLAAMRINPKFQLPVIDRTPEPIVLDWETSDRLLLNMLAIATHREGLSSFELSEVAERMQNRGKHLDEISQAIKRSPSWISRILTARKAATPKLLVSWRKGEVTDEQFKDSASEKNPEKQAEVVEKVVEANKSGNKAEARAIAKETAISAKEAKAAEKGKHAPVVKGPQLDLIDDKNKGEAKPVEKRAPMTSRIALEELARMAGKRPPVHELVKGIVLGVRYALGEIEPDAFGKPWLAYLERAGGDVSKVKAKAKTPAPKTKKPAKARRPAAKKAQAPKPKKSKR